jgi:DNA repair exonuclease SbcCD ATPase subunit
MPKSPDPKLIMERNRLLEEVERLNEKIRENDTEIRSRGEKLSELTMQLDSLQKSHDSTKIELDTAKSNISALEIQFETTLKEKDTLTENLNNLTSSYKTISETTQNYSELQTKIAELDEQLNKTEAKNRELNEKIFTLTQEKDGLLKEKLEFLESSMNEKMELRNTLTKMEHQLDLQKDKIKELREKKRNSEEGLLGSTMQIEQLKKEIDTKARQIEDMRSDGGIVNDESGIINDMPSLVEFTQNNILNVSRSLRIVCPDVDFLLDNGLVEILKQQSKKLIINLAVPIDAKLNQGLIDDFKQMGARITNTSEKNIFALNIDNAKIALGVVSGVKARVLFTDIPELVSLLTEALMTPFVKGVKV